MSDTPSGRPSPHDEFDLGAGPVFFDDQRPGTNRTVRTPFWTPLRFLVFGISGFAILATIGGVVASWYLFRTIEVPRRVDEPANERYQAAREAFDGGEPHVPPEVSASLSQYLARLTKAIKADNLSAVAELWDSERMIDEMLTVGDMGNPTGMERLGLVFSYRFTYPQVFLEGHDWESIELRACRLNPAGDEAVIWCRTRDTDQVVGKTRFWLSKRDDSWRFYDVEDMKYNVRETSLQAAIHHRRPREAARARRALDTIASAETQALAFDWEGAARELDSVSPAQLPDPLLVYYLVNRAWVAYSLSQLESVLEYAADARAHGLDIPLMDHYELMALAGLERHQEALTVAERYLDRLGPDADIYSWLGGCLVELDRTDEALAAFRSGLKDNPDSIDNLFPLMELEPDGIEEDLRACLDRMLRPAETFESLAYLLLDAGELGPLETLMTCYATRAPDDAGLSYYRAELKLARGEHAAAAETAQQALESVRDPQRREELVSVYLRAMAADQRWLEAYENAPDPVHAFEALSDIFLENSEYTEGDTAVLTLLIEAHRARHPDDHWLHYYSGVVAGENQDWATAAVEYRRGRARAPRGWTIDFYSEKLSDALYRDGRLADALEENPDSFNLLVSLTVADNDPDALATLIELGRARDVASESEGYLAEARLLMLREQYDDAVRLLQTHRRSILEAGSQSGYGYGYGDEDGSRAYDGLMFEALVQSGRYADAAVFADPERSKWNAAILAAFRGDVSRTEELLAPWTGNGWSASNLYGSPLMAKALRTEAMRPLRAKYPDPLEKEEDSPLTDKGKAEEDVTAEDAKDANEEVN